MIGIFGAYFLTNDHELSKLSKLEIERGMSLAICIATSVVPAVKPIERYIFNNYPRYEAGS